MIAYVREQGAKIRREGERLLVCGKGEPRILFAHQLEQLVLFGAVHMTAQARSLLFSKRIETVFLSMSGSYRGRLGSHEGENVFLRKKQFLLHEDEGFRLKIAGSIVAAKLHNQATMLGRLKREHNLAGAGSGVEELKALTHEAPRAETLDSLRGIEGRGAAVYFSYFGQAFHEDWGFARRARRPPTDPVNVILSLLYSLFVDRCHAACRLAGLDPYPANLHELEYGRLSLPLDLVEEFRAIFCDALTLTLFNKRMLQKDDFEEQTDDGDEAAAVQTRPLSLREGAFGKVLEAFSRKMAAEFHHEHAARTMSYADAVNWQAQAYKRLVNGEAQTYLPVRWH